MISASHNPPKDNGIKIFDENGEKISSKKQLLIDQGMKFREVLDRPIKKVPSLNGKSIVNLFFENEKLHLSVLIF